MFSSLIVVLVDRFTACTILARQSISSEENFYFSLYNISDSSDIIQQ